MKRIKKIFSYALCLCGIMCGMFEWANSQSFTATVNKNPVAVGDRFQITFTVEGGNGNGFKQPNFKDFQVIGGPFQSNNFTMVNGRTTVSSSYSYYLTPIKEGSIKIGSASINIDGKTYTTNPITMTCTKGQPASQGNGQSQNGSAGGNASTVNNKQVFIRASIDKSNLYMGEGVLITYKLYTSVALSSPVISDLPSFNGFWSSEINVPENTPAQYENYNGTRYATLVVKKFILFPQQSGTITIDPMKGEAIAQVQVKRNRNPNDPFDIFNDPFFGGGYRNEKVEIRSDAFKINVKDLPANAPVSFNGAVGRLQFDAQLDKGDTKANEAVTLKVKVSGKGNLKLIEAPKIDVPGDIETYDPKVDDNINVAESGTSGNKTFEYLLIPRHEGEYTIDALRFSYFDLETKTYREVTKGPFTIKVAKGDGSNATVIENAGANKTDVAVISKDIRYIKTGDALQTSGGNDFYGTWKFYSLLLLPLLLGVGAIAYKSKLNELQGNVALAKSRGAGRIASKKLSLANKFLNENKTSEFYDETYKALIGYVSDKITLPLSDFSKENATEKLAQRLVKPETITMLTETLDRCEFARFAPSAATETKQVYEHAVKVITQIENEIAKS